MASLAENWVTKAASDKGEAGRPGRGDTALPHTTFTRTAKASRGSVVKTHLPTQEPGVDPCPSHSTREGKGFQHWAKAEGLQRNATPPGSCEPSEGTGGRGSPSRRTTVPGLFLLGYS